MFPYSSEKYFFHPDDKRAYRFEGVLAENIVGMGWANERRRYNVTSSPIAWANGHNGLCLCQMTRSPVLFAKSMFVDYYPCDQPTISISYIPNHSHGILEIYTSAYFRYSCPRCIGKSLGNIEWWNVNLFQRNENPINKHVFCVNSLIRLITKKSSKIHNFGSLWGKSVSGREFPLQRVSTVESHDVIILDLNYSALFRGIYCWTVDSNSISSNTHVIDIVHANMYFSITCVTKICPCIVDQTHNLELLKSNIMLRVYWEVIAAAL